MGISKILGIRNCMICGKEIEVRHKKRMLSEAITCSKECLGIATKKKPNVKCFICGKEFHIKQSRINKLKEPDRITCSYECSYKERSNRYSGENNHQYGLTGSLNASWKSDEKITNYGYKKIRIPSHPFLDCDGFILEHRLLAEKSLLFHDCTIIINGEKYLSPEYVVHHKDYDRLNNDLENLQIMTKTEHMSYHATHRGEQNEKNQD